MKPIASPTARGIDRIRSLWPGLLTAATIAMAAVFVSSHYGGPTLLYALLLGIAFNFLADNERTAAGIECASRQVLRIGVALLGARIGLERIAALGYDTVALVAATVVATIAFGWVAARALGLGPRQGVLTGGAVGICGASAALAIAAVLPRDGDADRNTLFTIVGVTSLGTLTMILYPTFVGLLGLEGQAAGVFLGGTIHDVAQVVGAGYMVSETAGDTATVTKLLRVAMLVPVVLLIGATIGRGDARAESGGGRRRWWDRLPLPPFLIAFIVMATLNSLGWLPAGPAAVAESVSRGCLVAAIAGIGMKTDLRRLVGVGWAAVGLMVAETAFMAAVVLGGIHALAP